MYPPDYTTGDENDEYPADWGRSENGYGRWKPTPRPGEPGYEEYKNSVGNTDDETSVVANKVQNIKVAYGDLKDLRDTFTAALRRDFNEQLSKQLRNELEKRLRDDKDFQNDWKTNFAKKRTETMTNRNIESINDTIKNLPVSPAVKRKLMDVQQVSYGLAQFIALQIARERYVDFFITSQRVSNDIMMGFVRRGNGLPANAMYRTDPLPRDAITFLVQRTKRENNVARTPFDTPEGVNDFLDDYFDPMQVDPIPRTKNKQAEAELEALRVAKDQTIEKLKEEITKIREKAQTAVTEANDAIAQYEQSPSFIGVVLDVAPFNYDEEAFTPGTIVRLHKGVHAGSMGKIVAGVTNHTVKVEVLDRDANVMDTVIYPFRPKPNGALVRESDDSDVWVPLFNHEYKVGMEVMVTITKPEVAYATETKAEVVFPPTPSGEMDVKLDTGEVVSVNVGTLGYLSPEGLQAGWAFVHARGEIIPCAVPKRTDIEIGASVICNQGGQIIDVIKGMPNYGNTLKFNKYVDCTDKRLVELTSMEGQPVRVYNTITEELKSGDSVLLDSSNSVALEKVVVEDTKLTFKESTNVSWDDIGGVQEAKQAFMEAIEYPVTHAEIYGAYGIKPPKGIMLYGSPGCLAADTIVEINRGGKSFKLTIEELFVKFNGGKIRNRNNREHGWDLSTKTRIRSHVDGHILLVDLLAALDSGVKETYTVTFKSGNTIRATWDHPFLTTQGWKKCIDLVQSDLVLTSGTQKGVKTKSDTSHYQYVARLYHHPFAGKKGSKSCPYAVLKHRLVVEAANNGLEYTEYVDRLRNNQVEGLIFLDPETFAVHHLNSDHKDNRLENLQVLTHSEHHALEAKEYKWKQLAYKAGTDEVVSVDYYGSEQTYDLTVQGDDPNFVANGVIVHNTGKTMIAKAAVTSLKNTYKSDADTAFIYVKGPEILSQWVGVAEEKIRNIFAQARAHKATHGFPALVFIDEADAILGVRGASRSSDVDKTIVPQFLAEMDGLEDSGCILVLATNRPDSLDPAVTRNGRIDRKVKVARPDYETAKIILGLYTKNVPFKKGLTNKDVIDYTIDLLFHETLVIKAVKMTTGLKMLNLGQVVNGAMLASLVDIAKSNALQRDLKVKKPTGVTLDDMKFAVRTIWQENLDVNYDNDLRELIGTDYKNIIGEETLTGVPEVIA